DLRSSPMSTSSSKIPKRRGELLEGVLDTLTPRLKAHYTPQKAPILKPASTCLFTDFDSHLNLIPRELTALRPGCRVLGKWWLVNKSHDRETGTCSSVSREMRGKR